LLSAYENVGSLRARLAVERDRSWTIGMVADVGPDHQSLQNHLINWHRSGDVYLAVDMKLQKVAEVAA
jgi:hypothetical protein